MKARSAWLITLRDGLQTSLTPYQSKAEGLEALGLPDLGPGLELFGDIPTSITAGSYRKPASASPSLTQRTPCARRS